MVLAEAVAGAYLDLVLWEGVHGADDRLAFALRNVVPVGGGGPVPAADLLRFVAIGPLAPLHMAASRVAFVVEELLDDGKG